MMKWWPRSLFTRLTLLLSVIGCVVWAVILLWRVPRGSAPPPPAPPQEDREFARFRLEGVRSITTDPQGRTKVAMTAKRIEHRKRRLGPFTVNPVTEIILEGVKIELYRYPEDEENKDGKNVTSTGFFPYPPSTAFQDLLTQEGLGIVSRVVLEDLTISLQEAGQPIWTLKTDRASLLGSGENLRFQEGFSLTTPGGERLESRSALWLGEQNQLQVRGRYRLIRPDGATRGGAAFLTVDRGGRLTPHPIVAHTEEE